MSDVPTHDEKTSRPMTRREAMLALLRVGGAGAGAAALAAYLNSQSRKPQAEAHATGNKDHSVAHDARYPEMVVVQGEDPRAMAARALAELGGVGRFIKSGESVLIKPNIGWDRTPEQAANTNPFLVAELVKQCREAGARKIVVTDVTCHEPRRCFERSGIAAAATAEGAEMVLPDPSLYRQVDIKGDMLRVWPVLEPFLKADKVINVPIAKHHSLAGVTLGMKNWYGILGGQRMQLHQRLDQSLVDLAAFMRPTLTIIDCYRILTRNGPVGGDLADVAMKKTIVAGTDIVALDAYVARAYWNKGPEELPFLALAEARGLGTTAFEKINFKTVTV